MILRRASSFKTWINKDFVKDYYKKAFDALKNVYLKLVEPKVVIQRKRHDTESSK